MATTPRAIRLSEEELAFLQALRPHFPEVRTEADLQHQATLLGLWLLATAARRPGLRAYGGYDPTDLAALLRPRLLVALDFLAEQGIWPGLLQATPLVTARQIADSTSAPPDQVLDPEAAAGLADWGSDFLD